MLSKNVVVIYDLDLAYGNGLLSHLIQRQDFGFDIKLVTSYQSFEEIRQDIDLLLLDEALEDIRLKENVKQVLYLSEGKSDNLHLNRYQSIDSLIEEMKEKLRITENEGITIGRTELVSVYSPIGGCGKTRIAKALSKSLAKQGKEVYYFDFGLVPENPRGADADFLYDIHEGITCNENMWSEYFTLEEGVYCMNGSLYNVGLWSLEEKDIAFFMQTLKEREAMYILDIGFLNQAMISIIEKSDKWILPRLMQNDEDKRVDNLIALLKFQHKEEILNKIVEVSRLDQVSSFYKEQVQ